jgi:hypothetical protein
MVMAVGFSAKELKEEHPVDGKQLGCVTRCSRCGGLMVAEEHMDLLVQRCVQCGERIDPVILQNRQLRLQIGMS